MTKKLFSLLLVLTVLVSCIGTAFVTEVTAASTSSSEKPILADWVFDETVYLRGADELMKEYSETGITDIYLLVKGYGGKLAWQSKVSGTTMIYSTRDILEETCTAAKKYGIRVHCWIAGGRDDLYAAANPNSVAYHFRAGTGSDVTQYMDFRHTEYRAYIRSLIKELNSYDIAGIHFDYIRFGTLFYDWGGSARNALINDYGITQAEYNAATKAMCVTANSEYGGSYYLTTNTEGYYVYASSGTYPSGASFAQALNGNGTTDANNGAKKIAQMRKDNLKNFIAEVTADLSDDKVISCAIMPESVDDNFAQAMYCQDPAVLKDVVDYVAIMSYASQYGGANTWPATLAKKCAADGCDAVAAVQTFDCENSNADPTCTDIYNEYYNVMSAREAIKNDSSYSGKILGAAFFRAAKMALASAYVKSDSVMNFTVHNQDELSTSLTKLVFTMKNGVKISNVSNKNGWGSSSFSVSSDKTTLTITNSSGVLGNYGSATFDITYTGTVSETTGACMLQAYNSSGEDYAFCQTMFPTHEHSYTSKVTKEATCAAEGVRTFTCDCGTSYTEAIAKLEHAYKSTITTQPSCKAEGVRTYTCTACSNSYTEAIEKISHNYSSNYDSVTDTTTYTCDTCGASFVSSCGINHSSIETWSTGTNTHFAFCYGCNAYASHSCYFVESSRIDATCTADGTITYICGGHIDSNTGDLIKDIYSGNGCTNTYAETIPAGCTYTYVSNLDGTHNEVCTACGKTGAAVACTYAGGVCEICGYCVADYTMLHFKSGSAETKWNWELSNSSTPITFNPTTMGSMIGKNDSSITNPYFLVWPQDTCGINHTVLDGDVIEVRLRVNVTDNPGNVTTVTPDVRLQSGTGSYASRTNNATQTINLNTTAWQTVQIPIVGKIYSEGYVINRVLFDPWVEQVNIGGNIEIDYIYIGKPSTAPSNMPGYLYFDFTNSTEAGARYGNDVYEGYNFDVIPWAYNTNRNTKPTFNYENEGTLVIEGIKDTYVYAHTTVPNGDLNGTPLEYTVGSNDVVEIRFKTENLVAAEGLVPTVRLYYDINNNGATAQGLTIPSDAAAFLSGEYTTITTSINGLKGSLISAIRPMIQNISDDGSGNGKVIIDYIYVGPAESKPSNYDGAVYFDFTNNADDRIRYDSYTYGFYNYDTAGWGVNAVRNGLPTFNNNAGTMTTVVVGADPYVQIYRDGPNFFNRPFHLDPSKVEMVQVRLRLDNLVPTSEVEPAKFIFKFMLNDDTQVSTNDLLTYTFSNEEITGGKYITISLPVGDLMDDVEKITTINLSFQNIMASEDATSAITFDYIYAGPKMDGVNFVYFYNEDGTNLLYTASADEETIVFNGTIPSKMFTNDTHFEFAGWADKNGKLVDLDNAEFTADTNLYASYKEVDHDYTQFTIVENGHYAGCACGFAHELEDHEMDEGVISVPATCEEDGVIVYTCEVCGYTEEEVYEAEGHVYETTVIEATCTEDGYTIFLCSCGDTYNDEYVDATGHSYTVEVVKATCTNEGYTLYTCQCGESYMENYQEAIGHDYECVKTEATCTSDGKLTYTCANCDDEYEETIAATGHNVTYYAATKATCTTQGLSAHYKCSNCNKYFVDAECSYEVPVAYLTTSATGHKVTFQEDKEPTCAENGYNAHYKCSNCGSYYIDPDCAYPIPESFAVIPALSHNYTATVTAPTCTEKGGTLNTCVNCGDSYLSNEVPALGHSYTSVVTAPTCTAKGYTTFTCANCGDSYITDEVKALGHSYTYTNNGANHIIGCANCALSEVAEHEFANNVCICGAKNVIEPVLNTALNVSPNISIGAEMKVVYTIPARVVSSYAKFYVKVSKTVEGGEPVVTTYGFDEGMTEIEVIKSGSNVAGYRVTYTGIGAKNMGDEFTATLYAETADGVVNYGVASVRSIKADIMEKLANAKSSDTLKRLCVDMLNYGAAAQLNFNYDVENLVNADLTEAQKALGTQTEAAAGNKQAVTGSGALIVSSVSVQSKVMLYVTVPYTATANSNLKFIIKDAATGKVLAQLDANKIGNAYQCIYEDVGAKQMRQLLTIELHDNGTAVSRTLTWSVESYVAATRANANTSATLRNMIDALLIYGDSAAAYLDSTSN